MRKLLFLFPFVFCFGYSQTTNFPLKLSRADDEKVPGNCGACNSVCESRVKVVDERPVFCGPYQYPYILYPVIIEEFDFKEELPNNWAFNYGYTGDDDYDLKDNGHLWLGSSEDAYANNVSVYGGSAHLILKKEDTNNKQAYNDPTNGKVATFKNYRFTASALTSRFKTRQGLVKVVAKFPENNLLWLGFWKRSAVAEIDVIEVWDDKIGNNPISNCETYHQMKMHIWSKYGGITCVRGRKFDLPADFYNDYHKYVCDFTDYRIDFALDDQLVGYANKYYDWPYLPSPPCNRHTESGIPNVSHGCNTMQNLKGCIAQIPNWVPIIGGNCIVQNKVDKDNSYPNTQDNMDVRISVALRDIGVKTPDPYTPSGYPLIDLCKTQNKCDVIEDKLYNDWNNFSDIDKEIAVDRIEVWHLIDCARTLNLNNLNDFLANSASGKTGFASGGKINVSNAASTGNFVNVIPSQLNAWADYPIHLLATDEIAFQGGDIEIYEGTYLRAEIISCNGQSYNERLIASNGMTSDDLVTDEDIKEMEKQKLEEYFKENPEMRDSIAKMYVQEQYTQELLKAYTPQNVTSVTDNGSIIVYPNPTNDILNIDMVEEDYNDILYLELTNNLGQTVKFEKGKQINLDDYTSGMYQLKFIFSHGYIVVKSISKL